MSLHVMVKYLTFETLVFFASEVKFSTLSELGKHFVLIEETTRTRNFSSSN